MKNFFKNYLYFFLVSAFALLLNNATCEGCDDINININKNDDFNSKNGAPNLQFSNSDKQDNQWRNGWLDDDTSLPKFVLNDYQLVLSSIDNYSNYGQFNQKTLTYNLEQDTNNSIVKNRLLIKSTVDDILKIEKSLSEYLIDIEKKLKSKHKLELENLKNRIINIYYNVNPGKLDPSKAFEFYGEQAENKVKEEFKNLKSKHDAERNQILDQFNVYKKEEIKKALPAIIETSKNLIDKRLNQATYQSTYSNLSYVFNIYSLFSDLQSQDSSIKADIDALIKTKKEYDLYNDSLPNSNEEAVSKIIYSLFDKKLKADTVKKIGEGVDGKIYDCENGFCVKIENLDTCDKMNIQRYERYKKSSEKFNNKKLNIVNLEMIEESTIEKFSVDLKNEKNHTYPKHLTFSIFKKVEGTAISELAYNSEPKSDNQISSKDLIIFLELYKDFVKQSELRHEDLHFGNIMLGKKDGSFNLIDLANSKNKNGDVEHLAFRLASKLYNDPKFNPKVGEQEWDKRLSKKCCEVLASIVLLFSFDGFSDLKEYYSSLTTNNKRILNQKNLKPYLLNVLLTQEDKLDDNFIKKKNEYCDIKSKNIFEYTDSFNITDETWDKLFTLCKKIIKNQYFNETNDVHLDAELQKLKNELIK